MNFDFLSRFFSSSIQRYFLFSLVQLEGVGFCLLALYGICLIFGQDNCFLLLLILAVSLLNRLIRVFLFSSFWIIAFRSGKIDFIFTYQIFAHFLLCLFTFLVTSLNRFKTLQNFKSLFESLSRNLILYKSESEMCLMFYLY